MKFIAAISLSSVAFAYEPFFLQNLRSAQCSNCDILPATVGFQDYKVNPFQSSPSDVQLKTDVNCYAHVPSKSVYDLMELTVEQYQNMTTVQPNEDGTLPPPVPIYLTHTGPCGVCSTFQDLSVYLTTSLTSAVKGCAYKFTQAQQLKCIQALGFTDPCAYIWLFNTVNTRNSCGGVCFANINSPNNQPNTGSGSNPCQTCTKTLNGANVCYPEASLEGSPFRLNPCLQCDVCNSGALFRKIRGRTEESSGLVTDIARPPAMITSVEHAYGVLSVNA